MTELLAALLLGLAGGMAPGPLHALILTTALQRGTRSAVRLAFAPLISDALPVLASYFLARAMSDSFARGLAVAGGIVVIVMGALSLRKRSEVEGEVGGSATRDYLKGALVNILNPHPWIFWLGAGAPLLKLAFDRGAVAGLMWLALFYIGLVGVKVVFAMVVGRGRGALGDRWLLRSIRVSALLMVGVGGWLIWLGTTGFG